MKYNKIYEVYKKGQNTVINNKVNKLKVIILKSYWLIN